VRAAAILLGALGALLPARAHADDIRPGGAVGGHFLIADGDVGGAGLLDVWAIVDWARIGGFVGAAATPSERDSHNRTFMPFGVSFAADAPVTELLHLSLRARFGMWGGATQAEKLTAGVFFGGGAYLAFELGGGAQLCAGLDVWGMIASDAWRTPIGLDDPTSASTWIVAPGVGLTWGAEPVPAEVGP
jgi:hypothetical protein